MAAARRSECPWPGGTDIPSRVRDGACRPREHADLAGPDRSPPEYSGTHAQEEHADHGICRAEGLGPERSSQVRRPSSTQGSTAQRRRKPQSSRRDDEAPIIPILARKVREVEAKAQRGKLGPTNRMKFQVIAFLVREERARVKADTTLADAARAELLKRLDGVATILAKTAARDTSLIQLLEVDQAAIARSRGACAATGCSSPARSSLPMS